MATRFDPYVEWLQIQAVAARPTHYELLGVSSTESDIKAIEDAAKVQLEKLDSVEPGSRKKLVAKIAKEVRRSLKVLSDSGSRADYDRMLLSKVIRKQDSEPPAKGESLIKSKPDSEPKSEPVPKPESKPDLPKAKPVHAQIPMAKPIAKVAVPVARVVAKSTTANPPSDARSDMEPPKRSERRSKPDRRFKYAENRDPDRQRRKEGASQEGAKAAGALPKKPNQPPASSPANGKSESGSSRSAKAPKAPKAPKRLSELKAPRKKTNLLVPLMGLLLVGAGVAALGYFIKDRISAEPATAPDKTLLAQNHADDAKKAKQSPRKNADTLPVARAAEPPEPKGEVEELGSDRVDNDPVDVPDPRVIDDRVDGSAKKSDQEVPRPADPIDSNTPNSQNDPVEVVGGDNGNVPPAQEQKSIEEVLADLRGLTPAQQYQLKNRFYDAKNLWRQQQFDAIPRVTSAIGDIPARYELVAAVTETSDQLNAFWEHFATACNRYAERQIVVGEKVVGFVEDRPGSIILRIAGTNREYEHRFVPPGLIMAISDRYVDDEGAYALAKAAYYISQLSTRPSFSDRINELLTDAEDAGLETSQLRLMASIKFWEPARALPRKERVDYRLDRRLKDGLTETFELKSAKRVRPGDAHEIMRKLMNAAATPADGSHFGLDDTNDKQELLKRRMIMLEMARTYGIRGGYTPAVMDIIREIGLISDADQFELQYDSLIELAKNAQLDNENSKLFCDEILVVVRDDTTGYTARQSAALCSAGLKVAEEQNLTPFGLQLNNKLNSLANGN